MARKTAYVRQDNTAEFACTSCGQMHTITVRQPLRSSTPVRTRIRCDCGISHAVFLERRLDGVRHVDVPVVADAWGGVWALPARDASLQRPGNDARTADADIDHRVGLADAQIGTGHKRNILWNIGEHA